MNTINDFFLARLLRSMRFSKVMYECHGDVLDFGSDEEDLEDYITCKSYTSCNKDYSVLKNKKFDVIVSCAVHEHIELNKIYDIMDMLSNKLNPYGHIVITTPTPLAYPVLMLLVKLNLIESSNPLDHKHYWNKKELLLLGKMIGLKVIRYNKFQFGLNQKIVYSKC